MNSSTGTALLRECGSDWGLLVVFSEFRRQCKPEHAYALTIHKCQGSEFDHVLYGLHQAKGVYSNENWQHLYTAETRAKKSFTLIGTEDKLALLLRRKDKVRLTNLREKLEREMETWAGGDGEQ